MRGGARAGAGRKPAPTHLKVLRGNPAKRRQKEEPRFRLGMPACPRWLLTEAKAEWNRVTPALVRLGLLALVDRTALAGYCQNYARAVEAEKVITKKGMTYTTKSGQIKPRPEMAIAQRAWQAARQFGTEFGFTPSSRGRMDMPSGEGDDPLEKWESGGSNSS